MSQIGRRAPQRGQDVIEQLNNQPARLTGDRRWFLPRGTSFHNKMRSVLNVGDVDVRKPAPFAGQPWVTPILGSGPLGLPAQFLEDTLHLPEAVVLTATNAWPSHVPRPAGFDAVGADVRRWLASFTHTMIRQRVRSTVEDYRPQAGEPSEQAQALAARLDPAAALLVLVAAQLTRTFHRMSLDTCRPISRWGSERAEIDVTHDRRLDLDDEYVTLLKAACTAALQTLVISSDSDDGLEPIYTSIRTLVSTISTAATSDKATVSLVHLEQVTEAAWLLVVRSLAGSAYPGWTNLLLRLVLSDDGSADYVRPRWVNMETLSQAVHGIVEPVSKDSWAEGNIQERRASRDFYDSVALTLWAQNRVRNVLRRDGASTQNVVPAHPVAYVSSFDYELEMALWRTAPDTDRPSTFSVVFPAYAVNESSSHLGTFVWIEAVFSTPSPSANAAAERDPDDFVAMTTVTECRLLTTDTPAAALHDHPVVVRILGCPLLDISNILPTLEGDLSAAEAKGTTKLVHAVTVDEYLALRQTERDWVWSNGDSNRGLPEKYFTQGSASPQRYWMVLGVPFRDPAIRLRVMSILARNSSGQQAASLQPPPPPAVIAPAPEQEADPDEGVGRFRWFDDDLPDTAIQGAPSAVPAAQAPGGEAVGDGRVEPEVDEPRFGVAINTRTDDEEIMLLNSLGFPVVRGTCESFTEDMMAYAEDLRRAASALEPKEASA